MISSVGAWMAGLASNRQSAITFASLMITPPTLLFMTRCLRWHGGRKTPWDTGAFGLNVGGAVAASWMIVEAILDVGAPPGHWRVYVVILSVALLHHSLEKSFALWRESRRPPDAKEPAQESIPGT